MAGKASLSKTFNVFAKDKNKDAGDYVWRRPDEFLEDKGEIKLFSGGTTPNDIQ